MLVPYGFPTLRLILRETDEWSLNRHVLAGFRDSRIAKRRLRHCFRPKRFTLDIWWHSGGAGRFSVSEPRQRRYGSAVAGTRILQSSLPRGGWRSLAGQRVLGLLLGQEDLNDHEDLRKDPAVGAVLGCIEPRCRDCQPLVGKSTLNRFELAAAGTEPGKDRKVVVDFELHGSQEHRFHHGHYDEYCYTPLKVFCGREPVMVRLRTASVDPAAGVAEDLDALVRRLRVHWPRTRIILRTDSVLLARSS